MRYLRIPLLGLLALAALLLQSSTVSVATAAPTSRIAFHSDRDGNFEIYAMEGDGSGQTNLTNNGASDTNPAWSPNGSRIAFISVRDGNYEIYVMNSDGSAQTNLTNNPSFDADFAWSPDGSKIAFASARHGNPEIYVMNADGSAPTRLTNDPAEDGFPTWSPDGNKIAFKHREPDGNLEIYVMNADGGGQTRLTNNLALDNYPAWSPDGTQIAFFTDRDGNNEVYLMNTDGSNQTNLTNNPSSDHFAAWSPDGSKIAFGSGRDGNGEIYVMNADGSGQTRLTSSPTIDNAPSWWCASSASFVTRCAAGLLLSGRPYRFTGLNIYNANSDGWCAYAMNSGTVLDDSLSAIGPGKGAMRAWFFQPLATSNSNGTRDWSAFDHTLSVAAAHGVRVIVTLTDQWGECGVLGDGGTNYYKTKDWYINGYKTADPGMPASYRDYVAEVVTRYKDSPTVLMWQLINEAEVKESKDGGCLPGTESRDTLIAWASDVAGLIKSIDADHLVSLGTIGGGQCGAQYTQYQDVHAISTIDLCEYHDYSPNSPMPGDQWNGLQFRIDQCNALNKPLFVGEVGIKPDSVGGTLEARAAALRAKLDAQFPAGVDGILAWAWIKDGSALDNYDIGPGDPVLEVLEFDNDGDFVLDGPDNCPTVPSADQTDTDGDRFGNVCDDDDDNDAVLDGDDPCSTNPDCDADTWTDGEEVFITTNPQNACTPGGWPPDPSPAPNGNGSVDIDDVFLVASRFGASSGDPLYTPRAEIASQNGSIDIDDVFAFASRFGQSCT